MRKAGFQYSSWGKGSPGSQETRSEGGLQSNPSPQQSILHCPGLCALSEMAVFKESPTRVRTQPLGIKVLLQNLWKGDINAVQIDH